MKCLYVYDENGAISLIATNQPLVDYTAIYGAMGYSVVEEEIDDIVSKDDIRLPREHYVANPSTTPTLTARPASPITLDGTTLKDVPAGAIINIDGTEEVVETAEDVELVFPLSGTYPVRVRHFPYLDFVAEVTV